MLPQQAKRQGKRPVPEEACSSYIQQSISSSAMGVGVPRAHAYNMPTSSQGAERR
jgi:hypothetical protein